MTTTKDVFCDYRQDADDIGTSCMAWEHGDVGHSPTNATARAAVARSGWVHVAGKPSRREYDLCPEHAHHVPGETCPDWRGAQR